MQELKNVVIALIAGLVMLLAVVGAAAAVRLLGALAGG